MRVIEQERGRYEVQEVPYGKVYSWRPGRVRVECDCGAVVDLEGPDAACECGAKFDDISDGFDSRNEGCDHPWLEEYEQWRDQKEANDIQCEYYAFVGVSNDQ